MDKKLVPVKNHFAQTYDAMTQSNHATNPIFLPLYFSTSKKSVKILIIRVLCTCS